MSPAVLEDDNLLSEILLRLPPQPSSLPRASAVSKRWRSLASDPAFSRRFRIHHRCNSPLLGCFMVCGNELRFQPTLDPPNRLPEGRFPFPIDPFDPSFTFLGCRHGFLLMLRTSQGTLELLVWDPVNGREHPLAIPPEFDVKTAYGDIQNFNGAVLRTAHGDIQNFQVVVVSTDEQNARVIICVYSSQTGVWGNVISAPLPPNVSPGVIDPRKPAVLIGDSIYMLLVGNSSSIIEFDVDKQRLAVIPLPVGLDGMPSYRYSVMRAEFDGPGLVFVSTSDCIAQLWKRKTNCDGVASWVLGRTIELDNILSLDLQNHCAILIQGFAEENNVVFLWAPGDFFMVHLDSLQFKKLPLIKLPFWHPFECVYAAVILPPVKNERFVDARPGQFVQPMPPPCKSALLARQIHLRCRDIPSTAFSTACAPVALHEYVGTAVLLLRQPARCLARARRCRRDVSLHATLCWIHLRRDFLQVQRLPQGNSSSWRRQTRGEGDGGGEEGRKGHDTRDVPAQAVTRARDAVTSLTGGNRVSETVQPTIEGNISGGVAVARPTLRGEEIGAPTTNSNGFGMCSLHSRSV